MRRERSSAEKERVPTEPPALFPAITRPRNPEDIIISPVFLVREFERRQRRARRIYFIKTIFQHLPLLLVAEKLSLSSMEEDNHFLGAAAPIRNNAVCLLEGRDWRKNHVCEESNRLPRQVYFIIDSNPLMSSRYFRAVILSNFVRFV